MNFQLCAFSDPVTLHKHINLVYELSQHPFTTTKNNELFPKKIVIIIIINKMSKKTQLYLFFSVYESQAIKQKKEDLDHEFERSNETNLEEDFEKLKR